MNTYPHMCRKDHVEIGHADSEHELCPLCRMTNERDAKADRLFSIEVAANRFRKDFARYAKRKHSDAHVLQPHLDELFKLLESQAQRTGEPT